MVPLYVAFIVLILMLLAYWAFVVAQWMDARLWASREAYLRERSLRSVFKWKRGKGHLTVAPSAVAATIAFLPICVVGLVREIDPGVLDAAVMVVAGLFIPIGGILLILLPMFVVKYHRPKFLIPPKYRKNDIL